MLCRDRSGEVENVSFIVNGVRVCWLFFLACYVSLSGNSCCLGRYVQLSQCLRMLWRRFLVARNVADVKNSRIAKNNKYNNNYVKR